MSRSKPSGNRRDSALPKGLPSSSTGTTHIMRIDALATPTSRASLLASARATSGTGSATGAPFATLIAHLLGSEHISSTIPYKSTRLNNPLTSATSRTRIIRDKQREEN
ncbi:MAG: hypothetical protein WCT32_04455 [Patescibacteria group bacterium]